MKNESNQRIINRIQSEIDKARDQSKEEEVCLALWVIATFAAMIAAAPTVFILILIAKVLFDLFFAMLTAFRYLTLSRLKSKYCKEVQDEKSEEESRRCFNSRFQN